PTTSTSKIGTYPISNSFKHRVLSHLEMGYVPIFGMLRGHAIVWRNKNAAPPFRLRLRVAGRPDRAGADADALGEPAAARRRRRASRPRLHGAALAARAWRPRRVQRHHGHSRPCPWNEVDRRTRGAPD